MKKIFKDHDLIKILGLIVLFTTILTWIIPAGTFTQSGYIEESIRRVGIVDFSTIGLTSIQWFLQQIVFLLILGGFYGFLTRVKGYQILVSKVAKKIKGKEIPVVLSISFVFALLASLSTSIFQLLIFVPFVVTVLLRAKLNKIAVFSATFGSIIIGIMGATYSAAGMNFINQYMGLETETLLGAKAIIFFVTYFLFNFFTIKTIKENKKNEVVEDKFEVEETKGKSYLGAAIVLGLLAIFTIVGYINWVQSFQIEIFATFHEWLTGISIGEHTIIQYIIGTPNQMQAVPGQLGTWDLQISMVTLFITAIVLAIIYKVKCNDIIVSVGAGMKKMLKPITIFILINIIFVLVVWSPFVPTIVNFIVGLTEGFNVYLVSLSMLIASLFQPDVGYTGYLFGPYLAFAYSEHTEVISIVINSMYGLVQFIAPTSIMLMIGLAYLDIDYKTWFKHIWKFLVGIFVLLLIMFTILTYVF